MVLRALPALVLVASGLAGCLAVNPSTVSPSLSAPSAKELLAGAPLWADPQNTPHPLWNWPTLSSPATGAQVPMWWRPINATPLPDHIVGMTHIGHSLGIATGAGIAVFGSLAVVPEDAKKAYVVDIRDPEHPTVLSTFDTDGRGAAIIAYPNGRLVTALAGTQTITLADITDPYNPEVLDPIKPAQGSHKLGVVPGTPILYNAASVGGSSNGIAGPGQLNPALGETFTEIYDLSDPEHPQLVQNWKNGYSCHHIFFWQSADKQRAICAGIEYTQLWDTKDPRHPSVIVSIPVHYGVANGPSTAAFIEAFSHSAGINIKGNILYVGDENGGGGLPPGCGGSAQTPAGSAGTPVGSTWFYDISNEQSPRLLGYFEAPRTATNNPDRSCTTHHGRLVPDKEGRDLLAMSFYQDGVILIDFTGVDSARGVLPKMVDQWYDNSDTWETWYDQGYLFTGDIARGMDVLKLR